MDSDKRERRDEGAGSPAVNGLIFVACAGLPWMTGGWYRPLAGLGLLAVWVVLVKPTWRGLAPFYLTAALALELVLLAVMAILNA